MIRRDIDQGGIDAEADTGGFQQRLFAGPQSIEQGQPGLVWTLRQQQPLPLGEGHFPDTVNSDRAQSRMLFSPISFRRP